MSPRVWDKCHVAMCAGKHDVQRAFSRIAVQLKSCRGGGRAALSQAGPEPSVRLSKHESTAYRNHSTSLPFYTYTALHCTAPSPTLIPLLYNLMTRWLAYIKLMRTAPADHRSAITTIFFHSFLVSICGDY